MKCCSTIICILFIFGHVSSELWFTPRDLMVEVGHEEQFQVTISEETGSFTIRLVPQHDGLVNVTPVEVQVSDKEPRVNVTITGVSPGHVTITANVSSSKLSTEDAFVRITVEHSATWDLVSQIVGWVYFVAWSVSFYPQIYDNWKRKSVIGLNFDFLALNLLGFFMYSLFNVGLYWIPSVVEEYMARHPKGLNPVQINDIVFAIHALVAVILTISQCFFYERGEQTVSNVAKFLFIVYAMFLGISLVLAATEVIEWLDFLYYCSYVKLSITFIKYIPQAYMNYRRKSTRGWSIGNIFLDFTGGMLSMLQMIINSYNFNDWPSIFGDPTKFGLGLFSVVFDVFFIIQHYCLYRGREEVL